MKQCLIKLLIGSVILAGVSLMCYPFISNFLYMRSAGKVINNYTDYVQGLSEEEVEEQFMLAEEYNNSLISAVITDPFIPGTGFVLPDNYTSVLNINGMIGRIEIPVIHVDLPIYHGTSQTVLEKGIGHLDKTGFPIGGEGCHSVMTGHSGLATASLFSDLKKMEEEDLFYIHILDRTFAYQVDQIISVEPDDTNLLQPVEGKDYVTLITCTPYTINSHRLLVRGIRIDLLEYMDEEEENSNTVERMFFFMLFILGCVTCIHCFFIRSKHNGK